MSWAGSFQRSETGKRKDRTWQTLACGQPLHNFEDMLEHLAGLTVAELELEVVPERRVAVVSALTPLQKRAFRLPGGQPHPAPWAERLIA